MVNDKLLQKPESDAIQLPDGTQTPVRIWRADARRPVVAVWPGIGVGAQYYDPFARRLTEFGLNVVCAELRGQGESRPQAGPESRFGLHLQAAQDYVAVEALARRHFPISPQYVLGHSLGGQIAALYASRPYTLATGLILVASGTSHFRRTRGGTHRVMRVAAARVAPEVVQRTGYARAPRIGRQSAPMVTDMSRVIMTGRYEPVGADIDYEMAIARCHLPVLAIRVAGDTVLSPAESDCLTTKFKSAPVTRVRTQGRLGHNRWARQPDEVASIVDGWISER
ncbi:alpha/beta fold hydrolase [Gordonia sp. CPCC 205333]|uniref:alpha/beta fold hydrolase n=1 Tax=Gordonia sp. CPCC 205333 TaxID=3140790 RepID=UPI003AF37D4B